MSTPLDETHEIIRFHEDKVGETAFDRQILIEWWDQTVLANGFVLVAGAGALGNEAIKNLSLLGLGELFIVDLDCIEISNLSRSVLFRSEQAGQQIPKAFSAARQAKILNPNNDAKVYASQANLVWEVGLGVFRRANVVLGCVDNVEARRIINRYCRRLGKTWIDAGFRELGGSITFFTPDIDNSCYECNITEEQWRNLAYRYSCGDAIIQNLNERHEPTIQTTSAIIAGIQVQEAIKALHGFPIPGSRKLLYRGLFNNFVPGDIERPSTVTSVSLLTRNPACCMHDPSIEPIIVLNERASTLTVSGLLDIAAEDYGLADPVFLPSAIREEYAYIVSLTCRRCGQTESFRRPIFRNTLHDVLCPNCTTKCENIECQRPLTRQDLDSSLNCPACGHKQEATLRQADVMKGDKLFRFSRDTSSEFLELSLEQLGIPAFDIVCVEGAGGAVVYFELAGDAPYVLHTTHP